VPPFCIHQRCRYSGYAALAASPTIPAATAIGITVAIVAAVAKAPVTTTVIVIPVPAILVSRTAYAVWIGIPAKATIIYSIPATVVIIPVKR
jgi:hypothetical protein